MLEIRLEARVQHSWRLCFSGKLCTTQKQTTYNRSGNPMPVTWNYVDQIHWRISAMEKHR